MQQAMSHMYRNATSGFTYLAYMGTAKYHAKLWVFWYHPPKLRQLASKLNSSCMQHAMPHKYRNTARGIAYPAYMGSAKLLNKLLLFLYHPKLRQLVSELTLRCMPHKYRNMASGFTYLSYMGATKLYAKLWLFLYHPNLRQLVSELASRCMQQAMSHKYRNTACGFTYLVYMGTAKLHTKF
jgi:hypothetical protein